MEDLTLFIKEATSEEPIQKLETILMGMDGVERALVDIEDGEVKITYDSNQIGQEDIVNRIKQYGLHPIQG
ncbi:copper chaperone CopZ [Bacillus oleivorans]|uniref:Copper chaperone CopZ n=1 Tax=Bacillus oleivorans TaxID=1448271 RepID=A0A285CM17_9BACI|nr:heavy-metal-associated domain-containing protein [Bacillus oleivorans]SNX68445.1 copper chaperone CopZ [Bacillus oleivorans]